VIDDEPLISIDDTLADLDDERGVRLGLIGLSGADAREIDRPLPPMSSASIPTAPVSVRRPERGDDLEDHGEIGRGGMGQVHYVIDRRLVREMAMKILPSGCTPESEAAQRFIEEAQITGQLDHPNIVPVHQLGIDEHGGYYFTMKLVRGKTLAQIVHELGNARLDSHNLERMVEIVIKACDAVAFAHSRGVIHRDLKPSNLMVGNYGQLYVMDWGLADLRDGERLVDDQKKILGTPAYMAPEQALGRHAGEAADVYGLGGILYTVLTGERPHPGENKQQSLYHALTEPVSEPTEVEARPVPPELCRITMKALARDPKARHASVADLRADLEQFLRGGGWLATRSFAAGELIIHEGDEAFEAYIITDGRCEAYKEMDGARESLRIMHAGEVVGETALLSGRQRTASVVALSEVTVRVVTRDSLERELERNDWMRALFHGLAERFRELDAVLTDLLRAHDDP
jgi:serine/threonine-protein kinase